jgi:hypothetical protein
MDVYSLTSLLLLLPGCFFADKPAQPVTLPDKMQVDAIEIRPNFGEDRTERRIVEREKIDRFVKFINERDSGWKKPWDTFPSGRYTVVAKQGRETVAVFWPSPGHIGGRAGGEGARDNRLRRLTDKEWDELKAILSLDGPQAPNKIVPPSGGPTGGPPVPTWQKRPPREFLSGPVQALDDKNAFEVVGTMRDLAVDHELAGQAFVKIDPEHAAYLTGHYYRCPEGKTPYLVRAVYGAAGTGKYDFSRVGRKLRINHGSLGRQFVEHRSAFILNLDFEPEDIFVSAHMAE